MVAQKRFWYGLDFREVKQKKLVETLKFNVKSITKSLLKSRNFANL
jgi:hypothetical protein